MDRLKTTLFTALVIAILFTPTAFAQAVAANVQVISGNGQMICPVCSFGNQFFKAFYPMVVKVTDANGNPIANKSVNWQTVGFPNGVIPVFSGITTTDINGLSVNQLFQSGSLTGSASIPFVQTSISATADGASATFIETQALTTGQPTNVQIVFTTAITTFGTVLTGPAGSTGATPIQVFISGYSTPVPNVSLRLLKSDPNGTAAASCATGPGADPGSVLTDATGTATCYPVFGSTPGNGPISLLVGGLDPAEFDQSIIPSQPLNDAVAYFEYQNWVQLAVTPVTPGLVSIVSGNNQSINPGQASAPLVVKVTDSTGAVPIGGTTVTWVVTPAGQATVSSSQSATNSAGQAQTTVTFAANASGPITVRAALAGSNSGISKTFNLSTNVLISSLAKVSGDAQTTQTGKNFAAPLVVQVNGTNGGTLSNQPVSFLISSGTATLSSSSVLSDASGLAQITVTAGSTPGTVTISAFIQSFSQTFTLTIIPPGPNLSSSSFYNAGGSGRIGALSPCSLVTVLTSGLAPNVQGIVFNSNAFGPWATTLASDTVTVNNVAAPIYSVGNVSGAEQLTFQVPCETVPANAVPITINVGGGTASITFPVQAASPGIFETVMSDSVSRAVVFRPDGTFVSLQNPARRGEIVRVLVTGLGPASPPVSTGALPIPGTDSLVLGQVIVGVNNSGTRQITARVSPNLIGVFEVAFLVPPDVITGTDVVLSIAINAPGESVTRFSNGSKLPIQ